MRETIRHQLLGYIYKTLEKVKENDKTVKQVNSVKFRLRRVEKALEDCENTTMNRKNTGLES